MSEALRLQHRTWSKDNFMISTDSSLLPTEKLNHAFASSDVYWALPMPEEAMQETLRNSLCFGLYKKGGGEKDGDKESELELIGFARCVTDFTTFVYVTDVYVWPIYQGSGLGKWLIMCVQEVIESMPYLRRSMLFTSDWERSVPFYKKLMSMELVGSRDGSDGGPAILQHKGKGFPPNLQLPR
ncbi:gcn5-related n-acetyltransferase [Bisporella sp. PMI_857]|nr:gcn5-related n-acetyltransferase [Bisporella sp. PMI_857]